MGLPIKWINHIEAWQSSGLSQSAYCQQHGLNYNTFSARLCEYRKADKDSLPAFLPVQVKPSARETIVLKHNKGHQVMLPDSISASWFAELLRCLD